jgi:hypothetical protein
MGAGSATKHLTLATTGILTLGGNSTSGVDFGAEFRALENAFGAVIQGSTQGNTSAFFGNFRYNFTTAASSIQQYPNAGQGILLKDGVHIFSSNPGGAGGGTFTPSERMTISTGGLIGINHTSPGGQLHVVRDGAAGAIGDLTGCSFISSRTNGNSENIAIRHSSSTTGINGGTQAGQIISNGNNAFELYTSGNSPIVFGINSIARYKMDSSAFYPFANNTYSLGTSTYAWSNIYTNDLHLSNMTKEGGNDVDGTNGNWTIQEGAENLYIINNNNGKKFKIKLEEI